MIYDALIIGAGPSGATAALLLAQAGWSVAIVEKTDFPRRKVCGEFVSATNLPLLQQIGLADTFLKAAGPDVQRVGIFARDDTIVSRLPEGLPSAQCGRALRRDHLDALLLDRALQAGVQRWQPWTVREVHAAKNGYRCTITADRRSEELSAHVVIAAHGSWERSAIFVPRKLHEPSDLLAFKARFIDCELPAGLMPLLVFPGGYGGMVASDAGRVTLSFCIRRDQLQQCRERAPRAAAHAALRHIKDSCAGVRDAMKHARIDGAWLSAGPIRPGIRSCYTHGVFRIGNAAGEAHPIVAEGISMAMQSAWLLCRHLIAHQSSMADERSRASVGRDYSKGWTTSFAGRIRAASLFARLMMRTRTADPATALLRIFPDMLTFAARLSGKTRFVVTAPHQARAPSVALPTRNEGYS